MKAHVMKAKRPTAQYQFIPGLKTSKACESAAVTKITSHRLFTRVQICCVGTGLTFGGALVDLLMLPLLGRPVVAELAVVVLLLLALVLGDAGVARSERPGSGDALVADVGRLQRVLQVHLVNEGRAAPRLTHRGAVT